MSLITDLSRLTKAELILHGYGIDHPSQIDLEAIAYDQGASVRYRELEGCEARLVAGPERAIITVNAHGHSRRQRFSIGHELGHWVENHGLGGFACAKEDISPQDQRAKGVEAEANGFASQLILPSYLFEPLAARKSITLDTADALAQEFNASLSATAIKLMKSASVPAAVLCHNPGGLAWSMKNRLFPENAWIPKELHQDADAFELLFASTGGKSRIRAYPADQWLSWREAPWHNVRAQSVKLPNNLVLSTIEIL
jgi:hypothetical protein